MSKKAEIKKIVLDLGGKEIELSLDQAKKLNTLLGEMFGLPVQSIPVSPIIIERERPWWIYPYATWSSDNTQMAYDGDTASVKYSL